MLEKSYRLAHSLEDVRNKMTQSATWRSSWRLLPSVFSLFSSIDGRALATLLRVSSGLSKNPRVSALVLDRRFIRPLRALGYTVVVRPPGDKPDSLAHRGDGSDGGTMGMLCAAMSFSDCNEDLIAVLRRYSLWVAEGGLVVLRSSAREREHVSAAFLHAGLLDVQQERAGRSYLTAGVVAEKMPVEL